MQEKMAILEAVMRAVQEKFPYMTGIELCREGEVGHTLTMQMGQNVHIRIEGRRAAPVFVLQANVIRNDIIEGELLEIGSALVKETSYRAITYPDAAAPTSAKEKAGAVLEISYLISMAEDESENRFRNLFCAIMSFIAKIYSSWDVLVFPSESKDLYEGVEQEEDYGFDSFFNPREAETVEPDGVVSVTVTENVPADIPDNVPTAPLPLEGESEADLPDDEAPAAEIKDLSFLESEREALDALLQGFSFGQFPSDETKETQGAQEQDASTAQDPTDADLQKKQMLEEIRALFDEEKKQAEARKDTLDQVARQIEQKAADLKEQEKQMEERLAQKADAIETEKAWLEFERQKLETEKESISAMRATMSEERQLIDDMKLYGSAGKDGVPEAVRVRMEELQRRNAILEEITTKQRAVIEAFQRRMPS